jgi:hypothetical protein
VRLMRAVSFYSYAMRLTRRGQMTASKRGLNLPFGVLVKNRADQRLIGNPQRGSSGLQSQKVFFRQPEADVPVLGQRQSSRLAERITPSFLVGQKLERSFVEGFLDVSLLLIPGLEGGFSRLPSTRARGGFAAIPGSLFGSGREF